MPLSITNSHLTGYRTLVGAGLPVGGLPRYTVAGLDPRIVDERMKTLAELREKAEKSGLKGYSRMTKAQLAEALVPVEIHRGDLKAIRKLGRPYLCGCKVACWDDRTKKHPRGQPLSWLVPAGVLAMKGITPVPLEEAEANRKRRSAATKESRRARHRLACEDIGAKPGSSLVYALARGQIDTDEAELLAFAAEYRHQHTDYEALIRLDGRELARLMMSPTPPLPERWSDYLDQFDFTGEVAEALVRTLEDPRRCHPVWFKEAAIAVRRSGIALGDLTYEGISKAIDDWRAQRAYWRPRP